MAKLTVNIQDQSRDIKPYSEEWEFTAMGKGEEDYTIINTDDYISVAFNNKGTIKYIMVDPPSTGLTTLKIEYGVGSSIIELPISYGMGPFSYPIDSSLSSLLTGIFIKTSSTTEVIVGCRVYGE